MHVSSVSKNAADEKLKSCLRKFSHTHSSPGVVVLISGRLIFLIFVYFMYCIIVSNKLK